MRLVGAHQVYLWRLTRAESANGSSGALAGARPVLPVALLRARRRRWVRIVRAHLSQWPVLAGRAVVGKPVHLASWRIRELPSSICCRALIAHVCVQLRAEEKPAICRMTSALERQRRSMFRRVRVVFVEEVGLTLSARLLSGAALLVLGRPLLRLPFGFALIA